jgi:hypothetical protein
MRKVPSDMIWNVPDHRTISRKHGDRHGEVHITMSELVDPNQFRQRVCLQKWAHNSRSFGLISCPPSSMVGLAKVGTSMIDY